MSFLIEIENLEELRASLAGIDPRLKRTLTKAWRAIATVARDDTRQALTGIKPELDLEGGVTATARQEYAALTVRSTADRPTIAAVLGANVHPVFGRNYPAAVLHGVRPWMEHLGSGWRPEDLYVIGPVLAGRTMDEVVDIFLEAFIEALGSFGEATT